MSTTHKSNHSKNWKPNSLWKETVKGDKTAEPTMVWCGEDVKDAPNYSRRWKNVTCSECLIARAQAILEESNA